MGMISFMAKADWEPSEISDPGDIYRQAVTDREKGNYAEALIKHIWFHENALEIEPSYAGVRLSYNLDEWSILAKGYPQARLALQKEAEKSRTDVIEGPDCDTHAFHDFTSINTYLDSTQNTVELFIWLDGKRPKKAKRVFNLAFSDLLVAERYQLLDKYVNPEKRLKNIKQMYRMSLKDSSDPKMGQEMKEYAEQYFTYNVGALVSILVNTNKQKEAKRVVNSSKGKLNSDMYESVISNALNGKPPVKWP